jgi:hypothetical protein
MDPAVRDEEAGLPTNARPQRPRSSVPSFLFLSFMLFMLTSHNGDEFLARHQYQDVLQNWTYELSNYTAWLNGTASNFTMVSSRAWINLVYLLIRMVCCSPKATQQSNP